MKYRRVALDELAVDNRYQRPLDKSRVKKLVAEFDERLLGVLEISQRNGRSAVFDGQHRLAALKRLKKSDAPCLVHEGLSTAEEAELFVLHQTQRKQIKPVDRFRARLFAGDEAAVAMHDAAKAYGFKIGSTGGDPLVISAVVSLEWIYKRGAAAGLDETLALIAEIWHGDDKASDGYLLRAVYLLIRDYGDRLDGVATHALSLTSPAVILRRAAGGRAGVFGGGAAADKFVLAELRKASGVRGCPRVNTGSLR